MQPNHRYSSMPFMLVMAALIILAWMALAAMNHSPYARYLDHDILHHMPLALTGEYLAVMIMFVGAWVLMTVAMMLPSSLPLIAMFHDLTRGRSNKHQLVALLILGYLATWAGFGVIAHAGDLFVHEAVHRFAWLSGNPWLLSAALFTGAGIFQFTSLKYKCLDACRSPYSFITQHWRGRGERLQALTLGIHHGAYCVGCCWALMLLMFAFASFHLAAMLALGAVMAAEKNLPWGRKLAKPLGLTLVAAGFLVAITGASLH